MLNLNDMYNSAAKELNQILEVRRTLRKWGVEPDCEASFIGEYLCILQNLAKEFLFKNLSMHKQMLTVNASEHSTKRNLYAMANEKVALSEGNVDYLLAHGVDYELLWKALQDRDSEAIKQIDSLCMYQGGTISSLTPNYIKCRSNHAATNKDLYDSIVTAMKLHKKIKQEFKEAGLMFHYENGSLGRHALDAGIFLQNCLIQLFQLEPRVFTDDTTWVKPVDFTVYYPKAETPIDVSILDEDFDKLMDALDNEDTAKHLWNAFINYEQYAVDWLNANTKANIGPVEEDK